MNVELTASEKRKLYIVPKYFYPDTIAYSLKLLKQSAYD